MTTDELMCPITDGSRRVTRVTVVALAALTVCVVLSVGFSMLFSRLPVMDYETILKTHADKVASVIAHKIAARKRNMDDLFGFRRREETRRAPPTRPDPPSPRPTTQTTYKNEAEKILKTFNITTKLEWKKWLAQHHSDKGGSHVLTQEVINAGKAVYG